MNSLQDEESFFTKPVMSGAASLRKAKNQIPAAVNLRLEDIAKPLMRGHLQMVAGEFLFQDLFQPILYGFVARLLAFLITGHGPRVQS